MHDDAIQRSQQLSVRIPGCNYKPTVRWRFVEAVTQYHFDVWEVNGMRIIIRHPEMDRRRKKPKSTEERVIYILRKVHVT